LKYPFFHFYSSVLIHTSVPVAGCVGDIAQIVIGYAVFPIIICAGISDLSPQYTIASVICDIAVDSVATASFTMPWHFSAALTAFASDVAAVVFDAAAASSLDFAADAELAALFSDLAAADCDAEAAV
jgi:hypothetical protein